MANNEKNLSSKPTEPDVAWSHLGPCDIFYDTAGNTWQMKPDFEQGKLIPVLIQLAGLPLRQRNEHISRKKRH